MARYKCMVGWTMPSHTVFTQAEHLITRFAPSPTGYLHLGHAASANAVWRAAEAAGGQVLLRIEDIDQTRCKPDYEAAIYEDLGWLGFAWPEPVRRQSDHLADYEKALASLRARGLLYRCFRTRKEVAAEIDRAPHDAPQAFIGEQLSDEEEQIRLREGKPFAWRLSLARAKDELGPRYDTLSFQEIGKGDLRTVKANPEAHGDVILARKDTPTSYHLAACHDDALQGVTHIIRGVDLAASTHVHVLLQALMDWPTPVYTHHELMTDETGKRFAKRDKSVTLRALREAGAQPAELIERVKEI